MHGPKIYIYLPTHININEMMENAKEIKESSNCKGRSKE
jgi:hypothetical protein